MKRSAKIGIGVAAAVVTAGGFGTFVVSMERWAERCELAGGQAVSVYTGTIMIPVYTYNANGTIASVIMTPQDQYEVHCQDSAGKDIYIPE